MRARMARSSMIAGNIQKVTQAEMIPAGHSETEAPMLLCCRKDRAISTGMSKLQRMCQSVDSMTWVSGVHLSSILSGSNDKKY